MKRKINVIGNLNLDLLHPSIEIIAADYIGWAKNQSMINEQNVIDKSKEKNSENVKKS